MCSITRDKLNILMARNNQAQEYRAISLNLQWTEALYW
jgi:hypothetical protein